MIAVRVCTGLRDPVQIQVDVIRYKEIDVAVPVVVDKGAAGSTIHYAQGSTLASGIGVPVPRTVFGAGSKTEFLATPDWTGRPVAESTQPRFSTTGVTASPRRR